MLFRSQTWAVSLDYSLQSLLQALGWLAPLPQPEHSLLKLSLSQLAPILPYLFLVLVLIFRPQGLWGTREG